MKKILLICSHEHSGHSLLWDALNKHPNIQGFDIASKSSYTNPIDFYTLTDQNHKLNNRAAIYMDKLLYNHQLSTKIIYKKFKFIYLIREPNFVLNSLIYQDKKKISFAVRYYTYRLRRLYEMSRKTPEAVFLTWENLSNKLTSSLIENYLELKSPLILDFIKDNIEIDTDLIPRKIRLETNDIYEKYLYLFKNEHLKLV